MSERARVCLNWRVAAADGTSSICIFSATRSAPCSRTKDTVYAALDLGHFGAKLWRRDGAAGWRELAAPAFPPKPEDAADDPHPWSLGKIWVIEPGGVVGSSLGRHDAGWAVPLRRWRRNLGAEREIYGVCPSAGSGSASPAASSPASTRCWSIRAIPSDIRVGVSTGGMWASRDAGATWRIINRGMYNEYMPPDQRETPIAQDIHRLARCAAHPDIVWCQHHNAVFRSGMPARPGAN